MVERNQIVVNYPALKDGKALSTYDGVPFCGMLDCNLYGLAQPDSYRGTSLGGLPRKHPKCDGTYNIFTGDYDCSYETILACEDCKYGMGWKDPEAKCNQLKA